jgi:hypothetical protein
MELISLTSQDLLDLILEKSVKREDHIISSSASFLAIMSLLEEKLQEKHDYVATYSRQNNS